MRYFQTFRVYGSGYFPYDMLRYDHCFPADQDSVLEMTPDLLGEKRRLKMGRWVGSKTEIPTVQRWASFGWTVEVDSVVNLKP